MRQPRRPMRQRHLKHIHKTTHQRRSCYFRIREQQQTTLETEKSPLDVHSCHVGLKLD